MVPVVECHFGCGVLVSMQSQGTQYAPQQSGHSVVAVDSTSSFIFLPLLVFVVVVAVHRVSNAIGIEKQKGDHQPLDLCCVCRSSDTVNSMMLLAIYMTTFSSVLATG